MWQLGNPGRDPVRLLCIPYAGGGAAVYRDWPAALEGRFDVRVVELPGRGRRLKEPPVGDLDELVARLADELAPAMDGPHQVFGYSVGALVAFELVRRRRRQAWPLPERLVVAAAAAPAAPRAERGLHLLGDRDLADRVTRWGGLPQAVVADEQLLRLTIPALRADLQVAETYHYRAEPPLACPVTAFAGARDPLVTPDAAKGWEAETSRRFSLRILPGDHFFLQQSTPLLLASLAAAGS